MSDSRPEHVTDEISVGNNRLKWSRERVFDSFRLLFIGRREFDPRSHACHRVRTWGSALAYQQQLAINRMTETLFDWFSGCWRHPLHSRRSRLLRRNDEAMKGMGGKKGGKFFHGWHQLDFSSSIFISKSCSLSDRFRIYCDVTRILLSLALRI